MEDRKVHEKLRDYVVEQNIKQKVMAENMDISESRLSMMLSGRRKMTVEDYVSACKAIAVSPMKFL